MLNREVREGMAEMAFEQRLEGCEEGATPFLRFPKKRNSKQCTGPKEDE